MSTSGEIIARLKAGGMSGQAIGQAVGRDRSLISQVGRGIKPGENLRDSLAELERRLAAGAPTAHVPAPTRRTTASGRAARVRRPTTIRGGSWGTSTIKRQASRSGGRSLIRPIERAAEDGSEVAATIQFDKSATVIGNYLGKRGRRGPGGVVDINLGDARDVADKIATAHGGDVMAFLMAECAARGLLSAADSSRPTPPVVSVELRSF